MVTIHCPHCQSDALVRNGHAPMANSSIAAVPADSKAVRIRRSTPIHQRAARRSYMPLKNAAVYAASRAPVVSRARPCPRGSKKSQERQSFLDELWTAHSFGDEQQEPLSMRPWEKNKQANYLR